MTAPQRKSRRPAGNRAAADDENVQREDTSQAASKASAPPWFRMETAKWRSMTADLKPAERGILIDLLVQMHQRGEPLPNDSARLARACGTTKAAFERALTIFMADGRVILRGRKLWSLYVEAELENFEKRSQVAKENASKRWEKIQQNQCDDDAAAMRYRDSKIEDGLAPSEPAPDDSSSSTSSGSDPDARKGASGPDPVEYQAGQMITLTGIGHCSVLKRGTITLQKLDGVERKVPILLLHAEDKAHYACLIMRENGHEVLSEKWRKRFDEIPDESRKTIVWDETGAENAA